MHYFICGMCGILPQRLVICKVFAFDHPRETLTVLYFLLCFSFTLDFFHPVQYVYSSIIRRNVFLKVLVQK